MARSCFVDLARESSHFNPFENSSAGSQLLFRGHLFFAELGSISTVRSSCIFCLYSNSTSIMFFVNMNSHSHAVHTSYIICILIYNMIKYAQMPLLLKVSRQRSFRQFGRHCKPLNVATTLMASLMASDTLAT